MPDGLRKSLKDIDARDRTDLMRISVWFGGPCLILLTALWSFCYAKGWIPVGILVFLLILNIPLTVIGIFAINTTVGVASTGLMKTIYSAGDIPPPRTYPRQDTMIIRGQYAEAAEYFRDHLTIEPDDNEARLRLADLLEQRLNDAAGAERLYQEVRQRKPSPREEMAARNGLIDLYRKTGQRGRLKVELARFAERYRGSPQGSETARLLRELKDEDRQAEP